MRRQTLTILFLMATAVMPSVATYAQRTSRITRPCSGTATPAKMEIETDGDIAVVPCSTRAVRLLDGSYTSELNGTNYFSIGSDSSVAIPAANSAAGMELNFPWALSNTSAKFFYGSRIALTPSGSPAGNAMLVGNHVSIFTNAYTPVNAAGTIMYGFYSDVDAGFPIGAAYGGRFGAVHGSSQANGAGSMIGVLAIAGGGHNGNLTNAYAGEFYYSTGTSSPTSTTSNAIGLYARASFQTGTVTTSFKGLALQDWVNGGGSVGTSYGIYADSSIDRGASRYFIYSLSTSPSFFTGKHTFDATNAAGGSTGNQTIDKPSFSVNFAAGTSSLVVTNSFVSANSYVLCTVQTNDTTALLKNATPASGSVTIRLNANATAETRVACMVVN